MIRRTLWHTWRLSALLLVLLALLVSLARFGVPWLQEQRQQLLDWLVDDPAIQSDLNGLGARWSDYGPAVTLHGLTLQQKRSEPWQLRVQDATLQLDLWQSLRQRQWVIGNLQFQGVELVVPKRLLHTESDGQGGARDWQPLSRLLLGGLQQFELKGGHLVVRSSLGDLGSLDIARLRWENQGRRHRGDGELAFHHNGIANQIRLIADLHGPADQPNRLNGQLYLGSTSQRTAETAATISAIPTLDKSLHGELGFELWLVRAAEQWQQGLLKLADNQLSWQQDNQIHSVGLRGGLLQWQRLGSGWQLASYDLEVRGDEPVWRPWHIQLDSQDNRLSGRIDPISLPGITPVLALLAGEQSVSAEALHQMLPSGELQDLAFERQESDGRWLLSGRLHDLTWHRWQMVPGLRQLNGDFVLDADGGRAHVQLGAQTVRVGPYFPKDIPIDGLTAELHWQQLENGWQLAGEQIQLNTPALQAATDFRLDLPTSGSPYLALLTHVDLHDAGQAWRYYPRLAMGQGLTDYLQGALQGGQAHDATVLWDGPLAEFPYHQGGGIFQAWVPLREATFQFDPAWQPLKQLSLDLLFQNDTLDMVSSSAQLGKAHSDHIHAWFPTLAPDSRLFINADVAGEAEAVSAYLQDSGVKDSVGAALRDLQLSKPLTGDLQLVIPVDGDPVQVLGHVQFADNRLRVASLGLPLEKVNGELFFTEQETRLDGLTAELWNQPLRVDYQGQLQQEDYRVKIGLKGVWSQARAARWPMLWRQTLSGQGNWQGSLELQLHPKGRYDYKAQWQSNLQGVGLNWPEPYRKAAKIKQPLQIRAQGNQRGSQLYLDWQNGLHAAGMLESGSTRFRRLWIDNQAEPVLDPLSSALNVALKFDTLDLDDWTAWWQSASLGMDDATLDSAGSWLPSKIAMQLQAKQLVWAKQPWDQSSLQLNQSGQSGKLDLLASQVSGEMSWRPKQPLAIELSRLHWRTEEPGSKDASPQTASPAAQTVLPVAEQRRQLAAIPSFDFHCGRCQIDDALLGEVKVVGRVTPQLLRIPEFSLQSGDNRLSGQGRWSIAGGEGHSELQMKLQLASVEGWLRDLNYAAGIAGTRASGELSLSWLGPLYLPHKPSMAGKLNVEMGEGVLRKLDSAGTKLLSLLSLNTVVRRLSLDFSDVFEQGFFFKSIRASGTISQGVLHNEDFELLGDAGDIHGGGNIDLPNQRLDYRLNFTPHFANGVSLATAFAVTPVTGIYVLAASQILSPVIDVFTSIQFHISGPIDQPQVVEIGRETGQLKSIGDDYKKVLQR